MIHELNLRPEMEDSADLLFAPDGGINGLQSLQRDRLKARLSTNPPVLRPDWDFNWPLMSLGLVCVISALSAFIYVESAGRDHRVSSQASAPAGPVRLISAEVAVTPPAYTRQAAHRETTLDLKVPQNTKLIWRLRFAPDAENVRLVFHDGQSVALRRDGDIWTATLSAERSRLYRIAADGLPQQPLHRLEVTPDAPPKVEAVLPDRALTLVTPGQTQWPLVFAARDDYGVAPTAELRVIQAQGQGENITFRERTMTLSGHGGATETRFSTRLDLKALGFATGDDLIVQLTVRDNRAPSPQAVRSPSLILRWPSDLGAESTGLEGLARQTLPAYFRSQRQIIIDIEALLKEKPRLKPDTFLSRSDSIGVDQRLLRMRYGQFLGEKAEGEPEAPAGHAGSLGEGHSADDGHDHGSASPAFGDGGNVLAEYGHTHDETEAATLLDPETRATLKKALDEMWQSELHLRQGNPQTALPHAYKALGYIKAVQQATRIFLSRVGPELPPIDDNRRMTGKREGIASATLGVTAAPSPDAPVVALWNALAERPGAKGELPLGALDSWLRANESRVRDPLSLLAAVEAVRADPDCAKCRQDLRARLWGVLTRPPAGVAHRPAPTAAGDRYLDALERQP
ncbi:DUF4175 domain-containing protein [Asticcacaulis sp. AND118]|uniref:DUF4175 domain-containing protein n=1 Tax=Asticcacaulis sp. AND118 TaxID=2840468 RepID=UPI00210765DC|nr:DUF4175 domain-containing protein [Asticcacaulis sp. AND118]